MISMHQNGVNNLTKYYPASWQSALDDIAAWIAPALSRRMWQTLGERVLSGYEIGIKLILIGSVLFGFFQFVVYLLTWSASPLVQIPALLAWACGAIPLLFRLWWLDLSGDRASLTPARDYSETMLLKELLPTERFS